jgi:hypothetical protein
LQDAKLRAVYVLQPGRRGMMTAYNPPTAAPEVAAQLNRRTAQLLDREREIARLLEMIANLKKENQILSYLVADKEPHNV